MKVDSKSIALMPTLGFNQERVVPDGSNKIDYAAWDVGGCNIYGGEQSGDYFAQGSEFNIKLFLKNIPVHGIIWVVNVS